MAEAAHHHRDVCRPWWSPARRRRFSVRRAILIPVRRCARCRSCRRQGAPASLPGVVPGKYDRPTGCLLNLALSLRQRARRNEEPELRSIPSAVRLNVTHRWMMREADRMSQNQPLLQAIDLEEALPGEKGLFARRSGWSRRWTASLSPSSAAKRWRWSASRAAANRRSAAC